jgi:hypothetical protein
VSFSSTKVNNSKSNLSLSGLESTSDFNLNANNVEEGQLQVIFYNFFS